MNETTNAASSTLRAANGVTIFDNLIKVNVWAHTVLYIETQTTRYVLHADDLWELSTFHSQCNITFVFRKYSELPSIQEPNDQKKEEKKKSNLTFNAWKLFANVPFFWAVEKKRAHTNPV